MPVELRSKIPMEIQRSTDQLIGMEELQFMTTNLWILTLIRLIEHCFMRMIHFRIFCRKLFSIRMETSSLFTNAAVKGTSQAEVNISTMQKKNLSLFFNIKQRV